MSTNNGNKNSDSTTLSLSDMESDLAKTHHPVQGMVLGRLAKDETPSRVPGKGWIDRDRSKKLVSIKVICFGEPVKSASIDLQRASVDLSPDQLEIEPGNVVCVDKSATRAAAGRLEKVGFVLFPRNAIVELRDDLVQAQFEYKADSEIREQIKKDKENAEKASEAQKKKDEEKAKKSSEKKASEKKDEVKPAEKTEAEKKAEQDAEAAKKLKDEQERKEAEARAHAEKAEKERAEAEKLQRLAEEQEAQAKAAQEAARQAEAQRLAKDREEAERKLKEARQADWGLDLTTLNDEDVEGMLKGGAHLKHPERKPAKVSEKMWGQWKKAQRDADAKKV